jgi:hypothetical protein
MKSASSPRFGGRSLVSVAMAGAMALAGAASVNGAPRTRVEPYLEIQQVLNADFNEGDVLTYTGVGGGVNASVETHRVSATVAYNYQHRIAWDDPLRNDDVHSGLAAVHVEAIPGRLSFDAGAMATQSHADPLRPLPGFGTDDSSNTAKIYSAYAGPTLNTRAGPLNVGAAYRLGYVHVDDDSLAGALPPGSPRVDRYTSSTVHNATASVGMSPGQLPFGWTVGAGYVREDQDRLDSTFEGRYVRGDVVVPVGPTLAVTAGAGFEDMEASQADILRDAGGVPVIGPGGELIEDPSKPRLLTYDQSGFIWDAGVIWRPSTRTELQARVGQRYGGTTFTASLQHRLNSAFSLNASVYDNVSSFGRLLVTDLQGVPRDFRIPRAGLGSGLDGLGNCVFGTDPGTGACFDDALQSINSFNFRNRGASLLVSGARGPWNFGVGAGYNNRRYFAPPGEDFVLHGVTDHSFSLNGSAGRQLSRSSGFNLAGYAGWYDSGLVDADGSFSTGGTASYYQSVFRDRITATAAAGLYTSQAGDESRTVGSLLFGLRYSF